MGGECPNLDCKQRGDGHHHTLYGEDGRGGLVAGEKEQKACLQKKISRKGAIITVISIVAALLSSGTAFTVYGLEALKTDRAVVADNTNNIGKIQVELEAIKEAVESNQTSLEEIQDKMEHMIDPNTLKELITDAVKEGNK